MFGLAFEMGESVALFFPPEFAILTPWYLADPQRILQLHPIVRGRFRNNGLDFTYRFNLLKFR